MSLQFDTIIQYLTWRCNSKCITCSIWRGEIKKSNDEILKIESLKKIYSNVKAKIVYLTGGEVSLKENFVEIAEIIHRTSGARISFATNGILIDKIKRDVLLLKKKKIPFDISLSCNGFQQIHDFSRNIVGNYQKIENLIYFLKKNNITFSLSYTAFPFNIQETIPFFHYWRSRGGRYYYGNWAYGF